MSLLHRPGLLPADTSLCAPSSTARVAPRRRRWTLEQPCAAQREQSSHELCRLPTAGPAQPSSAWCRPCRRGGPAPIGQQWRVLALQLLVLHLCARTSQAYALSARTQAQAQELERCLLDTQAGTHSTVPVTTWNASVLDDALPNLVFSGLWWSKRPPQFNLTIITQLSVDRAGSLFNQCTTYQGPISAAVYLPLVQPAADRQQRHVQLSPSSKARVQHEVEQLQRLHDRIESEGLCQLDMLFFFEVFDDKSSAMLYPVNSLRNYARMQARTKLLSAIDVDMMPSSSLSGLLRDPGHVDDLERLSLANVATVLPAFEPKRTGQHGRVIADDVATGTKAQLAELWRLRQVQQFKLKVFPRGHAPTQYERWLNTSEAYGVQYARMFEPWFITHTRVMPWFDVNFKGYGLNKIVYVASLNAEGFSFQVHPSVWLVHRPHEDTAVRKAVTRQASDVHKLGVEPPRNSLYTKVTTLFFQAKQAMSAGTYKPRVEPRMLACMQRLPWLQPAQHFQDQRIADSLLT